MPDILIRGMCKLESGKSYRALFKELNGKFVVVVELVESYADREVEIYPVEELPPHGDLIERDALVEEQKLSRDYHAQNSREESLLERAIRIVREAPVIVPAERSDTDA